MLSILINFSFISMHINKSINLIDVYYQLLILSSFPHNVAPETDSIRFQGKNRKRIK